MKKIPIIIIGVLIALASLYLPVVASTTVNVAAVDATATEKSAADVQCDGVNDNVELQAALNGYNTVVLSSGNFYSGARVFMNNGNTIQGQEDMGTTYNLAGGMQGLWAISKSNITVRDLNIEGHMTGLTVEAYNLYFEDACTSVLVENVTSNRSGVDGLFIGMSSSPSLVKNNNNITVRHFTGTGSARSGIAMTIGRNVTFEDIIVWGNHQSGASVPDFNIEPANTDYALLQNVVIQDLSVPSSNYMAFQCYWEAGQHDVQYGVLLDGFDFHSGYWGANVEGSKNVTLRNGKIYDMSNSGIVATRDVEGFKLENTEIYNCGNRGVDFVLSSETINTDNLKFIGNDIHNNPTGMQFNATSKTITRYMQLNNNVHDNVNYQVLDTVGGWQTVTRDASATVATTSTNYTIGSENTTLYIGNFLIQVDNDDRCDLSWENDTVFHDATGNGNDGAASFRTVSNTPDVEVVILSQQAIVGSDKPPDSESQAWQMLSDAEKAAIKNTPPGLFREGGVGFPGGGMIQAVADILRLPVEVLLYPIAILSSMAMGIFVMKITHRPTQGVKGSLILMAWTTLLCLAIWVYMGNGVISGWVLIPFGIFAIVTLIFKNPYNPVTS
jgi:hypothetical protein